MLSLEYVDRKALDFLRLIAPYLKIKKEQADYLLANWPERKSRVRLSSEERAERDVIKTRLAALKKINYKVQKENYN